MSEHSEQTALFSWAKAQQGAIPELAMLFAIPNAGKRSYAAASYMQAEGLKSGVPDICLPVARGGYHGLFIEMKHGRGKTSEHQAAWLEALFRQGYAAHVVYGFDQAVSIITSYLKGA